MSPSGFAKLFTVFLLSFGVKATGLALVTLELGDPIRVALSGETVDLACKIHIPANSTGGKAGVYRVAAGEESLIGKETEYLTQAEPKTETLQVHFIAHNASFTGSYPCRYTSNEGRVQSSCYLLVRDVGYREPSSFIADIITLSILSAIFLVFSVTGTGVLLWKEGVQEREGKRGEREGGERWGEGEGGGERMGRGRESSREELGRGGEERERNGERRGEDGGEMEREREGEGEGRGEGIGEENRERGKGGRERGRWGDEGNGEGRGGRGGERIVREERRGEWEKGDGKDGGGMGRGRGEEEGEERE
ncbi:hypothetical protein HHUSO_G29330 [Huso huso]|uniref:Immunoglobulin subtype domain-containing protein n=1 Tax=Huso huso TaxID=61971 RepID=A0ABR0YFT0_HUSHU